MKYFLIIAALLISSTAFSESMDEEAFSAKMAIVEVQAHSHVGVVIALKEACRDKLNSFNEVQPKRYAQDYAMDIVSLEVVNQKDSVGSAVCTFNNFTNRPWISNIRSR